MRGGQLLVGRPAPNLARNEYGKQEYALQRYAPGRWLTPFQTLLLPHSKAKRCAAYTADDVHKVGDIILDKQDAVHLLA